MVWHPEPHKKMGQGTQELLTSTNTTVFGNNFYGKSQNWHGIINFVLVKTQFYIFYILYLCKPIVFLLKEFLIDERTKSNLPFPKPTLLWILVKLKVWKLEGDDQLSACSPTNILEGYMLREHQELENSNSHDKVR